ncbi:hypothetical protein [Nostoc sp.]|uniref:hypothetical protein n=1 Tax=Nostoc sp. TaxID=1180 RepID=UPI002FF9C627
MLPTSQDWIIYFLEIPLTEPNRFSSNIAEAFYEKIFILGWASCPSQFFCQYLNLDFLGGLL